MSNENNSINKDSLNGYLKEIAKYPLLTVEEEKKYGKDLKLIIDSHIVKISNKVTSVLDLEKVFKFLVDIKEYKKIINILKEVYKSSNDKSDYKKLCKYDEVTTILGKSLTEREYFIYFNSQLPKDDINLTYDELILEIENYLRYSYAKDKFMKCNLRLVVSVAKQYNLSTFDFLDIIGEGNIGLLRAIEKYDVDRNVRFSTYAVNWIKQSIINYISTNNGVVTLSRHIHDDLVQFNKKYNELKEQTGRDYSARELSEIFGIDYEYVVDYLMYSESGSSLDQPVKEEEDTTLGELLVSDEPSIDEQINSIALSDEISKLLSTLSPNQQYILKKRFGLIDRPHTLEEIAKELNITRERVRQIEARALSKLRKITRNNNKNLKLYLK